MLIRWFSAFFSLLFLLLGLKPAPESKTAPKVSGSFIQAWYCAGWDDARWDAETAWMLEAGIDTLILQSLASMDENGVWSVSYPSSLPVFRGANNGDALSGALKSCKKAGIRLFVGLADFADWWNAAGFSTDYLTVCGVMADMQREIYENYAADFGDTLYGWYFPPEIDNVLPMKLGVPRIAKGLNIVLETATALDPAMPMMLSPYFSELYTVPSALGTLPMWRAFFAAADFREGDIFCPQDAVGAGWTSEKNLEKVWQMYAAAVEGCGKGVRLWANCENFTSTDAGNVPAPLDRFTRQLSTASKYAEKLICFSMNHFYSPYTDEAAYDAYLNAFVN